MGSHGEMDDASSMVDRITTCLETLEPFRYDDYAAQVRCVLCMDKTDLLTPCAPELFGETAGGEAGVLDRFKVETIALAIAKFPEYGFSATVIKKGFYPKFIETASKVVYTVYRKYLEDHLAAEIPKIQLLALFQDHEFCYAWIHKLLEPAFLNNVIHRFGNQPHYLEAISYIYERTRATMLHMSDRFFHDERAGKLMVLSDVARGSLPTVGPFLRVIEECKHLHQPGSLEKFISKSCPVEWSDPCLLKGPSFPTIGKIWAYKWSADGPAKETVKALIDETTYLTLPFVPGAIGEWYTACDVVHGDRLWQWILDHQKTHGDLFHVRHPENHEITDPLASCFSPDTMIATDHGPLPIAAIQGGTRVLTRPPKDYGMVSNERVMRDSTIHRHHNVEQVLLLYGFNGEKPFVTSGHVFFTTTGPKALDPKIAQAENPGIHVTKLKVGDRLYRLNESGTTCQAVEIVSISYELAKCSSVHGLHFSRGANGGRYFANGYWVGENYPDVTVHSLLQRFASLTALEQKSFVKSVSNLPHTFRRVFGSVSFDAFQKAFAHPLDALHHFRAGKDSILTSVEHAAGHDVSVKRLVATFRLVSAVHLADRRPLLDSTHSRYERMVAHINEGMQLPTVTLANGAVLCDGEPVERVTMSHLSIRWSREVPNSGGKYEHGALRIMAHGKVITGVVGYGSADANVSDLHSMHHVYALADANDYHLMARTKWSTSAHEAEDESLGNSPMRDTFWTVRVGLARQGSGVIVRVTLPDLDDESEAQQSNGDEPLSLYMLAPMSFAPENGILKIPIKLRPGMEETMRKCISSWSGVDPPGPTFESITLTLDLQTNEVHGHYREISDDGDGNFTEGAIHALFSRHSDSMEETNVLSFKCVQEDESDDISSVEVNVHDTPRLYHTPASSASRELLPLVFDAAALSVSDLQSMPVPSTDKLFHLAQEYLQQAAVYWRARAERDLFGDQGAAAKHIAPPSFTEQLDAESRIFLAEYDRILALSNLANSQDYGSMFTEEQRLAIRYYFQGSSSGCLSQNMVFNKLWKTAMTEAFITLAPTVKVYMRDSRDWAQEFFDFVTTDAQLNAQAFGVNQASQDSLTTRYCGILSILDTSDRHFDDQLWSLVRNKLLLHLASGTIETDAYDWAGFATEFTRVLIDRIETGTKHALLHQLSIDLKVLREALFTTSAADIAGAIFGECGPLGRSFLEAVQSTDGIVARNGLASFSRLMSNFFKAIDGNCPIFARVKPHLISFCAMAVQGFTCYASLSTMLSWNELTSEDNGNAVLASLAITVNACQSVGSIIADLRSKRPDDPSFQVSCAKWNDAVGVEGPHISFVGPLLPSGKPSCGQICEGSLRSISTSAHDFPLEMQMASAACDPEQLIEDLESIFGFSSVASNTMAVATSVTSAMCLSLDIAREIRNGSSINKEAVDTINDLCIAAQTTSGASKVGFPTSGLLCGVNPYVGSIVASTGALLHFAEAAERPTQTILGPLEPYLDRMRATLFKSLPSRPSPRLSYTFEPVELLTGFHGSVSIVVRNTQPVEVLIDSITIRFSAGSGDSDMFTAPSGDDGNGNPTNHRVHYALENGHNTFNVIGSKLAGTTDHTMVLQLYSIDATGSAIPSEGLKLTISGDVNSKAGQAMVHITENTNKRPPGNIASDVYCLHKVMKCDNWVKL